MIKGYPKTRFEIIDETGIQEVPVNAVSHPLPLAMQVYTSDKGPENWHVITSLEAFSRENGNISFVKHGQAQLTVAEILRAGGAVLGKRMVAPSADLANVTIRARAIKVIDDNRKNVTAVYFYAKTFKGIKTFEDACYQAQNYTPGSDERDTIPAVADDKNEIDVPLFTVTPMGRGVSNLYFTIIPEYVSSKSSAKYMAYSFVVRENNEDLESILFTMNPDIIIDGVSQALNPKVKARSGQIKVNMYENELYNFMKFISETATEGDGEDKEAIALNNLINYDILRGVDKQGKTQIGGIVTINTTDNSNKIKTQDYKITYTDSNTGELKTKNLWDHFCPSGINAIDITDEVIGVYLDGGSWGKSDPDKNGKSHDFTEATILDPKEYNRQVRAVFGGEADTEYNKYNTYLFDTLIYDLDANYIDFMCDFGLDNETKNVIIDLANFRGDFMFFADLGLDGLSNVAEITNAVSGKSVTQSDGSTKTEIPPLNKSRYCALYHNTCRVYDPYTAKQIKVTLPFLLAKKIVSHLKEGVGRPFAGILHNITFPEIVDGTINFLPVAMPGVDQKQQLVDLNVNYISKYTQLPVMETMYVNSDTYSQLSYVHNIMAVQEIIKVIRSRCPRVRYTFMDGSDLQRYIDDGNAILNEYATNFSSISMEYMADEKYERNNIFYAIIRVRFKNFIQEEFFKIIAID